MASAGRSSSDLESLYFELQSDFGITKHMGGRKATDELIELCHLEAGSQAAHQGDVRRAIGCDAADGIRPLCSKEVEVEMQSGLCYAPFSLARIGVLTTMRDKEKKP